MFSFKMLVKILKKNKKLIDRYLRIILVLLIIYIFYKTFYLKRKETFDNCKGEVENEDCKNKPICFKLPEGISDYDGVADKLYETNVRVINGLSSIILDNIKKNQSAAVLEHDLNSYLFTVDRCCCGEPYIQEIKEKLKIDPIDIERYDSKEYKDIRDKVDDNLSKKHAKKIDLYKDRIKKIMDMTKKVFSTEINDSGFTEERKKVIQNITSRMIQEPMPYFVVGFQYDNYVLKNGADRETEQAFEKRFTDVQTKKILLIDRFAKYLFNNNKFVEYVKELHRKIK